MKNKVEDKPFVQLLGEDGNVFSIIGRCRRAARKAGWPEDRWKKFTEEVESGDYDHALQTVIRNFETV